MQLFLTVSTTSTNPTHEVLKTPSFRNSVPKNRYGERTLDTDIFGDPLYNYYDLDRGWDCQICLILSVWCMIKLQGSRLFYLPKQSLIYIYTPQFYVLPQCIAFSIHSHDGYISEHIDRKAHNRGLFMKPEYLPTASDIESANEFLNKYRQPQNIPWDHKYYNDYEKSLFRKYEKKRYEEPPWPYEAPLKQVHSNSRYQPNNRFHITKLVHTKHWRYQAISHPANRCLTNDTYGPESFVTERLDQIQSVRISRRETIGQPSPTNPWVAPTSDSSTALTALFTPSTAKTTSVATLQVPAKSSSVRTTLT